MPVPYISDSVDIVIVVFLFGSCCSKHLDNIDSFMLPLSLYRLFCFPYTFMFSSNGAFRTCDFSRSERKVVLGDLSSLSSYP